jgi:positive regulator of sigma E activity
LFSLDVITFRALLLYVLPILTFAFMTWVIRISVVKPPFGYGYFEWVGFVVFALAALCFITARRLAKRRATPGLRIPFILNAAAVTGVLIWLVVSIAIEIL